MNLTTSEQSHLFAYKFRAECMADVLLFFETNPGMVETHHTNTEKDLPDVEVTFTSRADIATVRGAMNKQEDGHVMAETLNYLDKYTGERNYSA